MNGEHKITLGHRRRAALVYLRQSTLVQVRENTESTLRQYALQERAVELGWAPTDVEVIDTDLGLSGTSTRGRDGFRHLMARLCLGEVGAIFGLEISRLGRSNADLAKLAELARLTDTLLIDADGVYDLSDFNDRLLLGLKSTMSETELHIMAGRLQAAKRAAAERGELRTPLPVGYVYDDEGRQVIDPDSEVQAAIGDVFATAGSAFGVVTAFADRRFPLRAYGGAWAGQLRWGPLTHSRALGVLKNPAYAGVYVFGRYATRKTVAPDGTVRPHTVQLPRDQWPIVIPDHHPGYITWADYLQIEAKLAANQTNAGARPAREGLALCQGIIRCGGCGRAMGTRYHQSGRGAYECSSRLLREQTPTCRSILAATVDQAVARALLDAVTPEQISLALDAAGQVTDRHHRGIRAAELAAERARYDADRAERAFHAAEPENRLVARSLENRWEAKLAALAAAEAALAAARDTLPPLPDQDSLRALAGDLPALWHAETTTDRDRKRLLRTLISDVTLLPETDRARARIGIRWHTGATDEISLTRAPNHATARRTPHDAVALIRELGPTTSNDDLVALLTARGLTTGDGRPFDIAAVRWVRHTHKIPTPGAYRDDEHSVNEVAADLRCNPGTVYYWINRGYLTARRGAGNRLCIPWNPQIKAEFQHLINTASHLDPRPSIPATARGA
ncbi:recombinase family protein [Parafrankia sp. FMc6]|uniref:recombinase family protein n=1 Tax=Parafrankia soli TaxID=2599596 RepID=UPI0034D5CAFB